MTDEFEARYLAVESRDARFDGRLFVAVTSTKIYCRPVCPALMPKRSNVRFYRHAAVAELAGFRPCRRCRPESSPDSPEWDTRGDLVGRGLRLIADGVADRHGTVELSRRLGVSPRHLQRVFKEDVGATPGVIARSRRAKLARQLLAESDLPITQVAFAAGFSSVRAFNETMQKLYKVTPSELRRGHTAPPGTLSLRLGYRPPLQTASLMRFLAARAIPGVEEVTIDAYRRSIRFGSGSAVVELRPADGHAFMLKLETDRVGPLAHLVQQARRLLDLDADPEIIDGTLSHSHVLAPLIRRSPGLRLPGAFDGFELGVRAILGQQVSVAGASTTAGRFVAMVGERIAEPNGTITSLFPTAADTAGADLERFGVPRRRRDTIRAFAAAVFAGEVVLDGSVEPDHAKEQLLRLPGIGPWTAEYIAMRSLRDPDAFPDTDLGVRHALEGLGVAGVSPRALSEEWRPWRGYAAMHLWESLNPARASR
jgi:AraC family transcriptional regulator of adaptative response / DNA-3-methyladenine glycosylase II